MNSDLYELAYQFYKIGMIEECKKIVKLIILLEIKEALKNVK